MSDISLYIGHIVIEEADHGSQNSSLVPLLLDPVHPPFGFATIQAIDFIGWDGSDEAEPFLKLYRDLIVHLEQSKSVVTGVPDSIVEPTNKPVYEADKNSTSSSSPALAGGRIKTKRVIKRPVHLLLLLLLVSTVVGVIVGYFAMQPNIIHPELVKISAGCFKMGSPRGFKNELPVHRVCFDRPFYLGKTEITFDQFDQFASLDSRKLPEDYWGRGNQPVINVSWQEALDYAQWLTQETGVPCRLPSEAEWEYVARAGTINEYALPAPEGSNDIKGKGLANCVGCGSRWDNKQTSPVGSFEPNDWGLHDMHGNVWEWVMDCQHSSYKDAPDDGSPWLDDNEGDCYVRMLRGGAWPFRAESARSAKRYTHVQNIRIDNVGFRVFCSDSIVDH
jgi:formylglycine-generating enzyme required for sulfatase activity